jgi:hypothetical protein
MNKQSIFITISLPVFILLVLVSSTSIFISDFYIKETLNWQVQSIGQDIINLLLVAPLFVVVSVLAYAGNQVAVSLWGGLVFYLTYTFTIYCFDLHFNQLFIFYCFILGLSFYSSLYFLFLKTNKKAPVNPGKIMAGRITGVYFLLISVGFYILWLLEIIPAIINNTVPDNLLETGLFTNGIHVLDLSIFLPAVFFAGIQLYKGKQIGWILAPPLLVFFVVMDITIAFLGWAMTSKGLTEGYTVTIVMLSFAVVNLIILIWHFKTITGIRLGKLVPNT